MIYNVANIGLDEKGMWTLTYFGSVPEQGGLEFKKGQISSTSAESLLKILIEQLESHKDTYVKFIEEKKK